MAVGPVLSPTGWPEAACSHLGDSGSWFSVTNFFFPFHSVRDSGTVHIHSGSYPHD